MKREKLIITKKEWKLIVNDQEIDLTTTFQVGICNKCQHEKEIRLISERKPPTGFYEARKFCWSCALTNLYELEESNYQLVNKQEIISELRKELNGYE